MKKTLLLITLFLLVACAYSPQQITINPSVDTSAEDYGLGRSVQIVVEDHRAVKELGSRGGVYKDTSLITIGNSITEAIAGAAEARLAIQGFNTNSIDADAATVKIIIDSLSYDTPVQSVGKKIKLDAILKLEMTAGNELYTGQYKSSTERKTVVTPSMESNEEMVNAIISSTLNRLFADPKLKAFLSNI